MRKPRGGFEANSRREDGRNAEHCGHHSNDEGDQKRPWIGRERLYRKVLGLPIVGVCIIGLFSGCGSVTQGIAFQPPAGWTGTPAMFGRFQMWMKSGQDKNSTQILMLVKGDASNMRGDLTNLPPQYSSDLKFVKRGTTQLCGGTQTAEQLAAEGTGRNGRRSQVDMISDVIGTQRYIAMYIRPISMAPDPQAESAIHSLCATK